MAEEKSKLEGDQKRQEAIEKARRQAEEANAAIARRRAAEQAEADKQRAAATKKHVWTKEDTYAGLAHHYYGSMTEPYWRLIYEHNKEIIGNHPNDIRVGLEIEIPPLPEELKKK